MKILLDENLPVELKDDLKDHQVFTVSDMGWRGKKNGELLGLTIMNGFQAFITMDKNLQYQQNLKRFNILIVVLRAINNQWQTLKPHTLKMTQALAVAPETGIIEIDLMPPKT